MTQINTDEMSLALFEKDRSALVCIHVHLCNLRSSAAAVQLQSGSFAKLAHPDIAEPHRIPVILEDQRQSIGVLSVRRALLVRGRASERDVVLDEDAVMQDRHPGRTR